MDAWENPSLTPMLPITLVQHYVRLYAKNKAVVTRQIVITVTRTNTRRCGLAFAVGYACGILRFFLNHIQTIRPRYHIH